MIKIKDIVTLMQEKDQLLFLFLIQFHIDKL